MAGSSTNVPQISFSQDAAAAAANGNFDMASPSMFGGRDWVTTTGLTWGVMRGYHRNSSGTYTLLADTTVSLTDNATNYVEMDSAGAVYASGSFTGGRFPLYTVVTASGVVTSYTDRRVAMFGAMGIEGALSTTQSLIVAASDETTALTTGVKLTFRMPYAFTLSGVRASLTTAQSSGSTFTVDIHESGTTVLSTKITIDNGEKTSTTASAPVISDSALADDAEITIEIDQIGDGTACGLKVYLIGVQ
jgi:hypothetical protein